MADTDRQTLKTLANALAAKATARDTQKQRQDLKKAEAIKKRLETRKERARARYRELKEQVDNLRDNEGAAKDQSMSAISKLGKSIAATRDRLRNIDLELREARALVKESRLLNRVAEKKQRALAQALLTYIKAWEKKHNKKYAIEIQNTRVRRRWLEK